MHCNGWDNWEIGSFKVSILGTNLEDILNRLAGGQRGLVREGSEAEKIIVEPWKAPEKEKK